jgi:hypothetical protein
MTRAGPRLRRSVWWHVEPPRSARAAKRHREPPGGHWPPFQRKPSPGATEQRRYADGRQNHPAGSITTAGRPLAGLSRFSLIVSGGAASIPALAVVCPMR